MQRDKVGSIPHHIAKLIKIDQKLKCNIKVIKTLKRNHRFKSFCWISQWWMWFWKHKQPQGKIIWFHQKLNIFGASEDTIKEVKRVREHNCKSYIW